MKKLAKTFLDLPWIFLLILVIIVDGLVGGVVRIANGKKLTTKIAGWALFISFVLSVLSLFGIFASLPGIISTIVRIIYIVCWVCDIITVALYKKFTILAK